MNEKLKFDFKFEIEVFNFDWILNFGVNDHEGSFD